MKQRIIHGAFVDMLTPDEFYAAISRPERHTRIRASETVETDGSGNVALTSVYKVPIGMEFATRRISFDIGSISGANLVTSSITLAGVGNFLRYLRSGVLIQYANPTNPSGGNGRVPGVETWGEQQGPYLRSGEVLQIDGALTGASGVNTSVTITVEGILTENRSGA